MDTPVYVNVFIVVAAVAIVVQAGILIALYAAFKKTSTRVETLATRVEAVTADVQTRVLPTIETAQALLETSRPKIEAIVDNLTVASATVRGQVERIDATVTEIVDRTRLHVARADELVTNTMDRVEIATEMVQNSVVSPVRVASGFLAGVKVGMSALFGRKRQPSNGSQHEEMFI
jgi:methyl-accepting chemotaxis protein